MSSIATKLVNTCLQEWEFFDHSVINLNGTSKVGRREYEDGAWQRISDYWKFIAGPYRNLTGKDRGTPWSAAFVSWCMHQAGAANRFPYSAAHSTYINSSIRDKNSGASGASLIAHAPKGYRLRVGDLIGYWRGETPITLSNALNAGWYQSHTDIVVEVNDGVAFAIGGNVLHSVTRRAVKLGKNGDLLDTRQRWFVVIENMI